MLDESLLEVPSTSSRVHVVSWDVLSHSSDANTTGVDTGREAAATRQWSTSAYNTLSQLQQNSPLFKKISEIASCHDISVNWHGVAQSVRWMPLDINY
jgi:hypothetical protein